MASFYGNIKNNSRASFIFDKIYTSRKEMEETLRQEENGIIIGDGVFINRYVLIDYNYAPDSNTLYVDRYTQNLEENEIYATHRDIDAQTYGANYDHTVWMKIYDSGKEHYIMVAELNAVAPTFELLPDAPSEQNGEPHFDLRYSGELNYKYHVPKNWDFVLNEYKTTENYDESSDEYAYYEINESNTANRSYQADKEYPYYNKAGFDPEIKSYDEDVELQGFKLNETESSAKYPEEEFITIALTKDTYQPNKYYIEHDGTYIKALDDYSADAIYYMISQKYTNNIAQNIKKLDTKRLDIYLPSIGNSISDVYDSIFGVPSTTAILGYTNQKMIESYAVIENEENNIPIRVENSGLDPTHYITKDQFNSLYVDSVTPQHDIPVYDPTGTRRPFNKEQIYSYINIEPYDNIKDKDPISIGWVLEVMKKYISELRYLSHGSTDNNNHQHPGIGLQSDWTLDDDNAFGYIYKKPHMLWKDDERTGHTANYVNSDIEWLYDNPTVNADSILDENPVFNCNFVTITNIPEETYYLTNIQEKNLSASNLIYPNIIEVRDSDSGEILGYTTEEDKTNYYSENDLIKSDIVKINDSFVERYINTVNYNIISEQQNNNYPYIIPTYLNNTFLGYCSTEIANDLPLLSDLIPCQAIEVVSTATMYMSESDVIQLEETPNIIYCMPAKINNKFKFTSEKLKENYKTSDQLTLYNIIQFNNNALTEYYVSYNQLLEIQQHNSDNMLYNYVNPVFNNNNSLLGFTNQDNISGYANINEDQLIYTLITEYLNTKTSYYINTTEFENIQASATRWLSTSSYLNQYKIYADNNIGYISGEDKNKCHLLNELKTIIMADISNDYTAKIVQNSYSTSIEEGQNQGCIIPIKFTENSDSPDRYITYDTYTDPSVFTSITGYTIYWAYKYNITTLQRVYVSETLYNSILQARTQPTNEQCYPAYQTQDTQTSESLLGYFTNEQVKDMKNLAGVTEEYPREIYIPTERTYVQIGLPTNSTAIVNEKPSNTEDIYWSLFINNSSTKQYIESTQLNNLAKNIIYIPASVDIEQLENTYILEENNFSNEVADLKVFQTDSNGNYIYIGYLDSDDKDITLQSCTKMVEINDMQPYYFYLTANQINAINSYNDNSTYCAYDINNGNKIGNNIYVQDFGTYYSTKIYINDNMPIISQYRLTNDQFTKNIKPSYSNEFNLPVFDNSDSHIFKGFAKNNDLNKFYNIIAIISEITKNSYYLKLNQQPTNKIYDDNNNIIVAKSEDNEILGFISKNILNQYYNQSISIQDITSDIKYLTSLEINSLKDKNELDDTINNYITVYLPNHIVKYAITDNFIYTSKVIINSNSLVENKNINEIVYQNIKNNNVVNSRFVYDVDTNYFIGYEVT